jgi:hypothetical protein
MKRHTTTEGNFVILNEYEYEKAMRERRIVVTAGSPCRTLLPERKPVTASST